MELMVVSDRPVVGDAVVTLLDEAFVDAQVVQVPPTVSGTRRPDVAVVDLQNLYDCLSHCRSLRGQSVPTVATVLDADHGLRMLQAGAGGIVTSEEGLRGVLTAVTTVIAGHTHVPAALLGGVLQALVKKQRALDDRWARVERLSDREREVLDLLGHGCDQTAIARRLGISPQTAKTHIRHVLSKLGVRSRIEAAALASELGLVEGGTAP